jgi:hypothetical protein
VTPAGSLAAFSAGLAVVFTAAWGLGQAVGPIATPEAAAHGEVHAPTAEAPGAQAAGLALAEDGYRFELETSVVGAAGELRFRILGPDDQPQQAYERVHDKELHLIVVRRDLTGYQHLHPTRDAQGTWSTPLVLPQAGPYKVFADFTLPSREQALILGADLTVPGAYAPVPLPPASPTVDVSGYQVGLHGALTAGSSSELTFSVSKGGRAVTDLDRYLDAYGHLVVISAGDLAYLHVHPEDGRAGPEVAFVAEVPSAGTYRMFLDFQHAGVLRTAELTRVVR